MQGGRLFKYIQGHPTHPGFMDDYHEWFDDFHVLDVSDVYTYTEDDAGSSEAVANEAGGVVTITLADNIDDSGAQLQLANETIKLADDKQLWFKARVKITTGASGAVTQSDMAVGFWETEDLTAVADNKPGEGVCFHCDDGDTNIDFSSADGGSDDDQDALGTLDTSYHTYGIYWNGAGKLHAYLDDEWVGEISDTANIAQDKEMAPGLLVRNGQAGVATNAIAHIDYVRVIQER